MFQNISDGQNLAKGLAYSPGDSGNSVSDRQVPWSQAGALCWVAWAAHSPEAKTAGQHCRSVWTWWRTPFLCGLSFPICDMGLRITPCLLYWVVVKIKQCLNTTVIFFKNWARSFVREMSPTLL